MFLSTNGETTMTEKHKQKTLLATAAGMALAGGMAPQAQAADNPFVSHVMGTEGYRQYAGLGAEGKCGGKMDAEKKAEGKCGASHAKGMGGKCGASMKHEKKTEKKAAEGKCGEGKCGGAMKAKPKPKAKAMEGKCGEGKCGGAMKNKG